MAKIPDQGTNVLPEIIRRSMNEFGVGVKQTIARQTYGAVWNVACGASSRNFKMLPRG